MEESEKAQASSDGDVVEERQFRVSGRSATESLLTDLGLSYVTVQHTEVHTVEAMLQQPEVQQLKGVTLKNLFLRDKKRRLYLLSARHDAEVRLQDLRQQVSLISGGLRLADSATLLATLGVRQGCVTPLALANDTDLCVTFLFDSQLLDSGSGAKVNCHPVGDNAATISISVQHLLQFLSAINHQPLPVQL